MLKSRTEMETPKSKWKILELQRKLPEITHSFERLHARLAEKKGPLNKILNNSSPSGLDYKKEIL